MGKVHTHYQAQHDAYVEGLEAEVKQLRKERLDVQDAFEPVVHWYSREGAAVVPTLAQMVKDAVEELQADRKTVTTQAAEIEGLRGKLIAAFDIGIHQGHTEAVEQVRLHCNLYHGWAIHETLEPLLTALRRDTARTGEKG